MTPPTVANISNENSTLYLCGCCQHAVTWTTPAILCDVCATWYHTECHNIQSDEYVKLGHSSADWLCYLCDSDDDDRTNHTTTHHLSHSLHLCQASHHLILIPSQDTPPPQLNQNHPGPKGNHSELSM